MGRNPEYPASMVSCGLESEPAFYKIHENSGPDREKNWSCVELLNLSGLASETLLEAVHKWNYGID